MCVRDPRSGEEIKVNRAKAHQAPPHLSERSKALWNQVVPARAKSPGRLELIRLALEELDLVEAARAGLAVEGHTFTTVTTGAIHIHPLHRVLKDAHARFVALWATLGLVFDSELDSDCE